MQICCATETKNSHFKFCTWKRYAKFLGCLLSWIGHSELLFASLSKRIFMPNHSYENESYRCHACTFIFMQIQIIFRPRPHWPVHTDAFSNLYPGQCGRGIIWKVLNEDLFWNRGKRQHRNGVFKNFNSQRVQKLPSTPKRFCIFI